MQSFLCSYIKTVKLKAQKTQVEVVCSFSFFKTVFNPLTNANKISLPILLVKSVTHQCRHTGKFLWIAELMM